MMTSSTPPETRPATLPESESAELVAGQECLRVLKLLPDVSKVLTDAIDQSLKSFRSSLDIIKSGLPAKEDEMELKDSNAKIVDGAKKGIAKIDEFISKVTSVFHFSELEVEKINEGINSDDYKELRNYANRLSGTIEAAKDCRKEAENTFDDLLKECEKSREYCCEKGKTAKIKKHVARGVGGTATAAAIAAGAGTGVTLSIIAGVFTLGIGTVVGLGLTAAGTAAAGAAVAAGAGATTFLVGKYYADAEEKFKSLTDAFSNAAKQFTNVFDVVDRLNRDVELMSHDIGELMKRANTRPVDQRGQAQPSEMQTDMLKALDLLKGKFDSTYKGFFSKCQDEIKECKKDI